MTCSRRTFGVSLAILLAACALAAAQPQSPWQAANADQFVFPEGMAIHDVKKDFGAVGDGRHDDTAALQKAFNQRSAFVYLPNGTYLVRDRIQFSSSATVGPTIQGQSRDGVIIRLADDAKGFDNPDKPRAVVRLINDGKVSADYFKTKIRNLTIDAGQHRGAIGLNFYANNNGMARTIRIVGQGVAGLDLSHVLNGPLLASNIEIEGFAVGVKAGTGPFNSQTLEHIVLSGQRDYGIYNDGECLMIRDVISNNACPAVLTQQGNIVLVDAKLSGGAADQPAILCASNAFIRNVQTDGYGSAIRPHAWDRGAKRLGGPSGEAVPAGRVEEWLSKPAVGPGGPTQARSLNLPIEVAPYDPLPTDFSKWVLVDDHGAVGDGQADDTKAVQKAFAAAAKIDGSVVCFRADARYKVSGDVPVAGGIVRVQGANSYVTNDNKVGPCRFVIGDGRADVVTFDLLDRPLGGWDIQVVNDSSRTVVVSNLRGRLHATGPGKTFLEDSCARIVVTNPKARVWARQLNSEAKESAENLNAGGTVWVLGLKTEGPQRLFRCTGGQTEILGGWLYQYTSKTPPGPMFEVVNASASFAGMLQFNSRGILYDVLLEATQRGQTRRTTLKDNGGAAGLTLMRTP